MDIKKEISDVILSLADAIDKEDELQSRELVKQLLEDKRFDWKDPDSVYIRYFYQNAKPIRFVLKEIYPKLNQQMLNKVCFIYEHYQFIANNLRQLVDLGYGCGEDKVGWLIRRYLDKCLSKSISEIPERNSEFHHYGQPDFGTINEWMNFIDELYLFHYKGYSENFKKAYDVLYSEKQELELIYEDEVRRVNIFYNALPSKIENLIALGKVDKSGIKNIFRFSLHVMEKLKKKVSENNCSEDDIISAINETEE